MRIPWGRSDQNLNELFKIKSGSTREEALGRIRGVFEKKLLYLVGKYPVALYTHDYLLQEVLAELSSLLLDCSKNWSTLKLTDIEIHLANLAEATYWKLRIKGYIYTSEATGNLAQEGMVLFPALKNVFGEVLEEKSDSMVKSLLTRNISSEADTKAVLERMLRCLVTGWRHTEKMRETVFTWDKHFQLGIKRSVLDEYLLEQLTLYSHLFKGEERALVLDGIRIILGQFVRKRISGPDRNVIVKDIVQDIFTAFFEEFGKNKENFFVDMKLKPYFFRLERNKKIINKYRVKYKSIASVQFSEEDFEYEEAVGPPEEMLQILMQCLKKLTEDCRKMIEKRWFGDYSETISVADLEGLLKVELGSLKNKSGYCENRLKTCVVLNTKQKGYRI